MHRSLKLTFGAAVVLAVLIRLVFFGISVTRVPPSGDECTNVLMAKHIAGAERPILFWGQPYQFPLEAYMMSALVRWMPRTAFGARYLLFGLSLLSVVAFLLTLRRMAKPETAWAGALLLLLPSAYWLTLQSACFIPNYTSFLLFSALLLWLAAEAESFRRRYLLCALAGMLAGLAYSCHMLVLPVVLLAGVSICLGRNWKQFLVGTPAYLLGLWAGLAPHWAAAVDLEGVRTGLGATRPLKEALKLLLGYPLGYTLPGALGVTPPLFPDFNAALELARGLAKGVAALYVILLATATVLRAVRFLQRLVRDRWPSVRPNDIFVGLSWLALYAFITSRRSASSEYRYLLPVAFSFPFIVSYLYAQAGPWGRRAVGAVAMALVLLNVTVSAALMREWAKPGFASGAPDLPDIRPVVNYLDQQGVRHCYATLWLSYRITHDTDERIICSQPFNERFIGWDLPQDQIVRDAQDQFFILSNTHQSRLKAHAFEEDMQAAGIRFEKTAFGPLEVYHSFRQPASEHDVLLPQKGIRAAASHRAEEAFRLVDGDVLSRWKSRAGQTTNMWIEIRLPQPTRVAGALFFYTGYSFDSARALNLAGRYRGRWHSLAGNVSEPIATMRFVDGHPSYDDALRTVRFRPATIDALRVTIAETTPGRNWSIGEIQLLGDDRD